MGNATRCPGCNRFGTPELGGYCKVCHTIAENKKQKPKPTMREKLHMEYRTNSTVVKGALLEVGKDNINSLTDKEVPIVYNCVQRRKPVNRTGHVVRGASPMESYGYAFNKTQDDYNIEKGVCDYERPE